MLTEKKDFSVHPRFEVGHNRQDLCIVGARNRRSIDEKAEGGDQEEEADDTVGDHDDRQVSSVGIERNRRGGDGDVEAVALMSSAPTESPLYHKMAKMTSEKWDPNGCNA